MRITSKGQVTIPAEIRERAGLLPETEVDFEFDGEVVRIVRAAAGARARAGRGGSPAATRAARRPKRSDSRSSRGQSSTSATESGLPTAAAAMARRSPAMMPAKLSAGAGVAGGMNGRRTHLPRPG